MKNDWDPVRLDVREFARAQGHLQGESVLADWPRLSEDAVEPEGRVRWTLSGATHSVKGGADQVWLSVTAELDMALSCQRCLGSVRVPVQVERQFRFVADEDTAASEDEDSEEDVLVLEKSFDALALLEDELIMALPMIPMHEACQSEQALTSEDEPAGERERPNPFAVLSQLQLDKSE